MEFDYKKKDVKKSPKVKSNFNKPKEGEIYQDGEIYKFVWNGNEHGFEKEKNAKIALERMKNEG